MHYDLIVCGAGPAGTMAANTAARAGLRVALLEKYPLPRHKTCGGGTPMTMRGFLHDLAPDAFVEADVTAMRHTWNFADPVLAPINPEPTDRPLSLWMMQRSVFDNALAQHAVQAGAELRDGLAVKSVEVQGDRVLVQARGFSETDTQTRGSDFTATANYVIGADGANGVTAKAVNLRQQRAIALAMEVEFPHEWGTGHPDLRPDIAHLEYGAVKRGYGWIFPKGDHLNVGAGLFSPQSPGAKGGKQGDKQEYDLLKQTIRQYLDSVGVRYDPEALKFRAHPLPFWTGKETLHGADGRILLAGDAAGLINPLFFDGILHAVQSGVMAAECVIAGQTLDYSRRIHAHFAGNFNVALKLSRFFYQYPGLCYRYGVKDIRATRVATQLLAGELAFDQVAGRMMNRVRKAMLGV